SITFTNQSYVYVLDGNPITLSGYVSDLGNNTNMIDLNIALTPVPHWVDCHQGTLDIHGQLSGPVGTALNKGWDSGEVELDNGSYAGPTTIDAGALYGRVPTGSAVTVMSGATFSLEDTPLGSCTIGSLSGAGIVRLNDDLYVGGDNATTSWTGTIYSPSRLIK